VLDRTKEPGSIGEPLFQDVVNAFADGILNGTAPCQQMPVVTGGRYGLSSKDFTPAMVKGVFDELAKDQPKERFTVGIVDDVTNLSIDYDPSFEILPENVIQAIFFGLGSDGTVGANKNSIKIIGDETPNYAQGYFEYDSKKSGTVTVSHLRFGPEPIRAPYFISEGQANFVACHQMSYLDHFDMLKYSRPGSVFLLNTIYGPDEVWNTLPREMQKDIIEKQLKFYVIDAYKVAEATGMGSRINTIMQTCFFAISGVLPPEEALAQIKHSIEKTYGRKGEAIVRKNFEAVDQSVANLHQVAYPTEVTSSHDRRPPVPAEAPVFVKEVLGEMINRNGDALRVSQLPDDGTYPVGTTKWENGISLSRFRSGNPICVSNARVVPSSARMLPFVPRFTPPSCSRMPLRPSNPPLPSSANGKTDTHGLSRLRPKIAWAAACALITAFSFLGALEFFKRQVWVVGFG